MAKQYLVPIKHLPAQPAVTGFANIPPTPAEGARYIVGSSPTGDWVGYADYIATWDKSGNVWVMVQPENGWRCYVTLLGKEYVYFSNAWGETKELVWGGDIQLQQGKFIYHREVQDTDSESDFRESVEVAEFQPFKKREWYNGENWIPRDHWFAGESILPSAPYIWGIELWFEENILPLEAEMPDKGIWIQLEIQYWMNHYFEDSGNQLFYHRSLTATKVLMANLLRTNVGQKYIPGTLSEIGFSGVYAVYDSTPTMYEALDSFEQLSSLAFPVSLYYDSGDDKVYLKLEQDLVTQHGFEDVNWDVKFQLRMKVIQYSQYDRTNEVI